MIKTNNKYILSIGLLKKDMATSIKEDYALNVVSKELIKNNVIGFNTNFKTIGFYKGIEEKNLIISFINTYDLKTKDVIKIVDNIKKELEQESILLEIEKVQYAFI